jgi:hypothetical protein
MPGYLWVGLLTSSYVDFHLIQLGATGCNWRRQREPERRLFRREATELDIFFQFRIPVRDTAIRVTDPLSNQVFRHLQLAKVTHTEAAKRVKAALLRFHLRENRVQRAAKHV